MGKIVAHSHKEKFRRMDLIYFVFSSPFPQFTELIICIDLKIPLPRFSLEIFNNR